MRRAVLAEERHELILRELALRGNLIVAEFAERVGVTGMTLRRDLSRLESEGQLTRVHGGAVPSRPANRRRTKPVASVGMVMPSAGYYFPEVIQGAWDAAAAADCRIILAVSDYRADRELVQLRQLVDRGVDAVIITPSGHLRSGDEMRCALESAHVPVVVAERELGTDVATGHVESVRTDHETGAMIAVSRLRQAGHQRVALAYRAETATAPWLIRGVERSVGEESRLIVEIPRDAGGAGADRDALETFLERCMASGFRAMIVLTDVDAITIEEIALARGISIPDELSIIAYDNEVAELAPVALTAVAPPKRHLGRRAFEVCLERIRGTADFVPERTTLVPTLVERDSVGPAPAR